MDEIHPGGGPAPAAIHVELDQESDRTGGGDQDRIVDRRKVPRPELGHVANAPPIDLRTAADPRGEPPKNLARGRDGRGEDDETERLDQRIASDRFVDHEPSPVSGPDIPARGPDFSARTA